MGGAISASQFRVFQKQVGELRRFGEYIFEHGNELVYTPVILRCERVSTCNFSTREVNMLRNYSYNSGSSISMKTPFARGMKVLLPWYE